jgi:radical SAM protein
MALKEGAMAIPSLPNFDLTPFIVIWETTQACDLACRHCRACAQPLRDQEELTTSEAEDLIAQVAELKASLFVFTGGDPLKRADIFHLVRHAAQSGIKPSLTPSATPLLTRAAVEQLRDAGLARLAVSLDGASAATHDAFRGVTGSFERTLSAVRWARELGLPVQINSTVTRANLPEFEALVERVRHLDIALWSVFFLVPTGRGRLDDLLSAEEFEAVFARLYALARELPFDIKTTEAQHYRRYALQQRTAARRGGARPAATGASPSEHPLPAGTQDGIGRAPRGINDGKGFVFISHRGEIFPSGFLPLAGGNIRHQSLANVYRNSELFRALRDSSRLEGKCGVCEYREICGGSRSRAYAITGNPFAEEPCCVYQPPRAQPAGMECVARSTDLPHEIFARRCR